MPDQPRCAQDRQPNAVLDDLKAHPEKENISVSQNDNAKNCLCPNCKAIDDREGTPMGTLLEFVNAVADEVAKEHPDVKVGTLSYWYTRKPPKTLKPRPNVQIQLCSIECCLIHPINDPKCEKNVQFCQDMDEWGKLTKNIFIWNYNTNFSNYLLPCPEPAGDRAEYPLLRRPRREGHLHAGGRQLDRRRAVRPAQLRDGQLALGSDPQRPATDR